MRELLPVVSDDLVFAETGVREPADRAVSVGFMGLWWELDLSALHYEELAVFIGRYANAGRRTRTPVTASANVSQDRSDAENMRAWADETSFRTANDKPGYHAHYDGKGGYYYTVALKRAWAAHKAELEETGGLGSDRPE